MSNTIAPLSLREARIEADEMIRVLRPHCERVEVAGSVRRGKDWVNDIEIVCAPKVLVMDTPRVTKTADLFNDGAEVTERTTVRVPGFVNTVHAAQLRSVEWGHQPKPFGDPWKGRYVKFHFDNGTQVDLFIASPDNWGYIMTIRTGSADFSKMVAARWKSLGYQGVEGELTRNGRSVPMREESDLFAAIGMNVPPPHEREMTVNGISKWIK